MKTIVIATDLTSNSENAIRQGMTLARDLGADAVLVHAWEPLAVSIMDAVVTMPAEKLSQHIGALKHRLDEVAQRYKPEHTRLSVQLIEGPPAAAIMAFAKEVDARMVVVGTSPPHLLPRLVGSVAEAVMRSAPCPVLVVHAPR